MVPISHQEIPRWLIDEVNEYFVPLPFRPRTILDIGANIGAFATVAHRMWPEARIICCEPMPFNVCHLRRNVPRGTELISAAIRAHSGVDEIMLGDNLATGSFVNIGRQSDRRIIVECLAAAELPSCELVKIDTEGCEVEILRSLPLDQTKAIFLEYHSQNDARTIREMLDRDFAICDQHDQADPHGKRDPNRDLGTLAFLKRV